MFRASGSLHVRTRKREKVFGEEPHIDACWGKDVGLMAAIAGLVVSCRSKDLEQLKIAVNDAGARWGDNFTSRLAAIAMASLSRPDEPAAAVEFLPEPGNLAEMFDCEYGRKVFGEKPTMETLFGKDMGLMMLLARSEIEISENETNPTATAIVQTAVKWADKNHRMIIDPTAWGLINLNRLGWPNTIDRALGCNTPDGRCSANTSGQRVVLSDIDRAIKRIVASETE